MLALRKWFPDQGCSAPNLVKAEYTSGCAPQNASGASTCAAVSGASTWFMSIQCVSATDADQFGGSLAVSEALFPAGNCVSSVASSAPSVTRASSKNADAKGTTVIARVQTCLPAAVQLTEAPSGSPVTFSSEKLSIDPLDFTRIYRSLYPDAFCSSANALVISPHKSGECYNSNSQSLQMIGPAPSSSITVYFADSSCSKPTFISLQVASSTQCTPVTACIYDKQGSGAYTKTQCSSQPVSISSIASSTFPTAYVQFNRHIDNECQALKAIEAKAVGACIYGAEDGISPGSHMVFIHASDASVSVSTYAAQDCSGLETSKSLYPGKEICYSNVNVDYARVSVFVGTATSIEGTTNASALLPVGAIAGGSISCVVVLTAFIAFCVYIARQKKHVAETQHVGSDSLQECILAPDTSSSNIASTHFMAVYSVSTPSQPRTPTPTSIVMSSITASGDHSPRLPSGAHSKLNSRETAFDLNTPETTAIERLRRLVADPIRSSYFVEREAPKEYTMFGALWLPVLPHQWETHEVAEWVKQNGAAEEIVRFIKTQEIDGRALLRMSAGDFEFPTVGRRLHFEDCMDYLKGVEESRMAEMADDPNAPPPDYPGRR